MISICIVTRNRAASLVRTLAALEAMRPADGPWDLLVVDNGSSDDTQAVVAGFQGRLPIRSVIEPRRGLSIARNTAVAEVRGEAMAWTDDDTIPDPGWLRAYEEALAAYPADALFGGRILPVLEEPVTPWFRDAHDALVWLTAERELGDAPIALIGDHNLPFGANFAVRTAMQRQFTYDVNFGPGAKYFGDETSLFKSMLAAGHTARWTPGAVVQHLISPDRQTERYVRWWFETLGRTTTHLGRSKDGPRMFGAPRWVWRRKAELELRYRLARLRKPPAVWVQAMVDLAFLQGQIRHFRENVGA